jgi:hypothetical protein
MSTNERGLEHLRTFLDWLEDSHRAFGVWLKLTGSPSNANYRRQFFKFLEVGEPDTWAECVDLLNDESRNRIEWLLGPNSKVMYEIWKAKNDAQDDE